MITQNDLLDLHVILCTIRNYPDAQENKVIISTIINEVNTNIKSENMFRVSLSNLGILDKEKWGIVYHQNWYPYMVIIKNYEVYRVLNEALKSLLAAINEPNYDKVRDLADVLHNLPIMIIENSYRIPKSFFRKEVMNYRKKWDNKFLK